MAEEKKKTLAEQINFSGKGKTEKRKKKRKKQWRGISKALGFYKDAKKDK